MKKIIVFGATGNTGVYLIDYLVSKLEKEYEIIAVGRRSTQFFQRYGIKYIQVDVSVKQDFDKLPTRDIFAVYMTSAQLPTHDSFVSPYKFLDTNVYGCLNILEYCRTSHVDRIIYTQTMSNIANSFGVENVIKPGILKNFPYKGDHAMYVITKNVGEELLRYYHEEFGIKTFIFHIPTIYQYRPDRYWYVDGKKRYRTFHHLIDLACEGKSLEMWGDPSSYKDIVYVKDYCQLLWRVLLTDRDSGIYNVGTGVPTTLKEMLEGIVYVFSPQNQQSVIIAYPEKPNTPSYVIDVQNAIEELGYNPEYSYLDLLRDFKKEMGLNRFVNV